MKKLLVAFFTSVIVAVSLCMAYKFAFPSKGGQNQTPDEKPVYDTTIKLLDFNIRNGNLEEGENAWYNRRDPLMKGIKSYAPDLMGFQEVCGAQYDALVETFGEEYGYFGYYRTIGDLFPEDSPAYLITKLFDEACPLFYRKERFDLISQKCFWLSETPNEPSLGWDGGCNRTCTIVELYDKYAEKKVIYANTHLDNKGGKARREGAKLIKSELAKYNCDNIIVAGDFNIYDTDTVYRIMSEDFSDARLVAEDTDNGATFNGFRDVPKGTPSPIDFIFLGKGVSAKKYKIVRDKVDGHILSDHYGLYGEIIYK